MYVFICYFSSSGSHGPIVDQDVSLSKRQIIQEKEVNQTDSISTSGEIFYHTCVCVCVRQDHFL